MTEALRSRHVPVAVIPIQWWASLRPSPRRALRRLVLNLKLLPALIRQLRTWDVEVVYTNTSVVPAGAMVSSLFKVYIKQPSDMPQRFAQRVDEQGIHRVVCDYIAGMTDRFCASDCATVNARE